MFHRLRENVKSGYDCQRTLSVGTYAHSLLVPSELLEGDDVVHYHAILTTSFQGSEASGHKTRGWEISQLGKVLAIQAPGLEFDPQAPTLERLAIVAHACDRSAGKMETSDARGSLANLIVLLESLTSH